MIDGDGGDEESPHQHLPAGGAERRARHAASSTPSRNTPTPSAVGTAMSKRSRKRSSGYFSRSLTRDKSATKCLLRHEPAHVAPEKAVLHRRVHVLRLVRIDVMMAVVGGPPDRSALHRRGAEQAEDELADPRGLEGAVREIAVIEAGDREHAHARTRPRSRANATQLNPTQITARQAACISRNGMTRAQSTRREASLRRRRRRPRRAWRNRCCRTSGTAPVPTRSAAGGCTTLSLSCVIAVPVVGVVAALSAAQGRDALHPAADGS